MKPKVERGIAKLEAAKAMSVTAPRGTDLRIGLDGAPCGGGWGYCAEPGRLEDHHPSAILRSTLGSS